MRCVIAMNLLAFVEQACADGSAANHMGDTQVDTLIGTLTDRMLDRTLKAPTSCYSDLKNMTFGKPSHLAIPVSSISQQHHVHLPIFPKSRRALHFLQRSQFGHVPDVTVKAPELPDRKRTRCSAQRRGWHDAAAARSGAAAVPSAAETAALAAEVRDDLRNIAIVAHVDHGKTTLVDAMLEQDPRFCRDGDEGCNIDHLMDNNDQERERGITILAKNCAITYKGTKINIVDTPGHADFGGEVERVLNMVDGVLLLVDASEGPKPQTRFVLKKAIAMGLKILVVVNKIDRPSARPDYAVDKTFDLFCDLGASDEQTEFPIVYTSAINRVAGDSPAAAMKDMEPLFREILKLPKPPCNPEGPLQLQISSVSSDNFIGRLGIGRIRSGVVRRNDMIGLSAGPGAEVNPVKVSQLFNFDALGRAAVDEARAGEIVVFSGIQHFNIGDTLVSLDDPRPLEPMAIEQPTMSITFGVNKGPFAGKAGKFLTSTQIKERLDKELQTNVALRVDRTEDSDTFLVSGRGLLHLTVLMETMRREGFELLVGCPRVIEKTIDDKQYEPFEMVDIQLPEEYSGAAIALLNNRKGSMRQMLPATADGYVTLQYEVPSRGMNGVKSRLLSATRGLVIMTTTFGGYQPFAGEFGGRDHGSLLSTAQGTATAYSIENAQQRGVLFSKPGDEVYENQIVGIASRDEDLRVNICKAKKLTNMRSAGSDDNPKITPAKELTLEDAVEYIGEGEYVEVTPKAIRMGAFPKKYSKADS